MIRSPLTFPEIFRLPLVLDLRTAARALGICPATAYRLIKEGAFPCAVVRAGRHFRVPTADLLRVLGIDELPVYAEDLARGIDYANTTGGDR